MKVIRHIHPIGQGAFYTERFVDDDNTTLANIVYDCGCGTNISSQAKKMIATSFSKNDVIDILFISHFDSDHINGIKILKENLKIRFVVMPLLKDDKDLILSFYNDKDLEILITDPSKFFLKETTIIKIKEVSNSEDNYYNRVLEEKLYFTLDEDFENFPYIDGEINSFQPITISQLKNYWIYIPFNFAEIDRKQKLESVFNNINYKEKDLISFLKNCNTKQIREIYNKIEGKINGNSLCVYSGPQKIKINNVITIPNVFQLSCVSKLSGCLFLGDSNLNGKDAKNETIIGYMKNITPLKEHINNIGLIQVPHHGSIKSFSHSIFSINPQCINYFLSYGKNTYGHPSDKVVEEILFRKNILHCINQVKESRLIQLIYFNDNETTL